MAETITIVLNTQAAGTGVAATVNGLQRVKNAADSVAGTFAGFARRFAAGLVPAVTLIGLGRMAHVTLENADAMGKAAQKAGEAVREFSQLAEVGKLSSVTIENLTQAAKALPEWLEKNGQAGKSLSQVILEQADVFAKMPDSLAKTALAVDMFGRSGQSLIPLLNQGSEALRAQMAEAEEFGLIIGPRFTKDANAFNDNLTRIWGIFRGISNLIASALLPGLIDLTEAFITWVKEGGKHKEVADVVIDSLKGIALGAGTAKLMLEAMWGSWGTFAGNLSVTGSVKEAWKATKEEFEKDQEIFDRLKQKLDSLFRRDDPGKREDSTEPGTRMNDIQAQRLELEKNSLHIARIRSMVGIGEYQRELLMKVELQKRVDLLEYAAELERNAVPDSKKILDGEETAEYAAAIEQANRHLEEMLRLQGEIFALDQDSFFERFSEGIQELTEEFDNLAGSIADALVNGIGRAIDTVSDGIWQVIDGTATWGDLFRNVARNIISDLIRIGLQEIVLDGLKRGLLAAWGAFSKMMRKADAADQNVTEATKTPLLGLNATLASIGSYGLAAIIGVAAIAAVLASVGAFEQGGVVTGGEQLIRVNERGTEAVLNARATSMLGAETINALNAGNASAMAAQAEGSLIAVGGDSSGERPVSVTVIVVDNQRALLDAIESSEGVTKIVEVVRNNKTEIGI